MPQISLKIRRKIVDRANSKQSISSIAKRYKINKSTVHYIVLRAENNNGQIEDKPKSGRPGKLNLRLEKRIVRKAKIFPKITSTELKTDFHGEVKLANSTIRSILIRYNLRASVMAQKPLLRKTNIKKRKEWCKNFQNYDEIYWSNVVFSDETIIERKQYVRRPPGKRYHPNYVASTVKFGGKRLMLWGFIKFSGERGLLKIEGKVNSENYIKILNEGLMPNMYLHEKFQQDNAPAHNSEKTKLWMAENGIDLLENWPPQSPDLNIIENVWHFLKERVRKRYPKNFEELWMFTQEEFYNIPTQLIQRLFRSIPRRLKLVVRAKGCHTKY